MEKKGSEIEMSSKRDVIIGLKGLDRVRRKINFTQNLVENKQVERNLSSEDER